MGWSARKVLAGGVLIKFRFQKNAKFRKYGCLCTQCVEGFRADAEVWTQIDDTLSVQSVSVFEILIRVMEREIGLVLKRRKLGGSLHVDFL